MSFDVLFEMIQRGKAVSEKDYLVADEDGWTIAHILASKRVFPKDFPCWGASDDNGTTVAHQAAYYKKLPTDFDQWELADTHGTTVAHIAARMGILPLGQLNQEKIMSMTNAQGVSVMDEYKVYGQKQIDRVKQTLKGAKSA